MPSYTHGMDIRSMLQAGTSCYPLMEGGSTSNPHLSSHLHIVTFIDSFNGWGVTLFDALDTMWLMDLHDDFRQSLHFVAKTNFTLAEVGPLCELTHILTYPRVIGKLCAVL